MRSQFAVAFDSDAYKSRIVFVAENRTPTLKEYATLVEATERQLAQHPSGETLVIKLGRLPQTDKPTMPSIRGQKGERQSNISRPIRECTLAFHLIVAW
jgi:hypothetical protein